MALDKFLVHEIKFRQSRLAQDYYKFKLFQNIRNKKREIITNTDFLFMTGATHPHPLVCGCFSTKNPDLLLTGSDGGGCYLISLNQLDSVRTLSNIHEHCVCDIKFSCSGNIFNSCSADKSIIITDFESNIIMGNIKMAHEETITTLSWHRTNENIFSSGSRDGFIKLWDIRTDLKKPVCSVSTTTKLKKRKHLFNRKINQSVSMCIDKVNFLLDPDYLIASSSQNHPSIRMWDLRSRYNQEIFSNVNSGLSGFSTYPGESKMINMGYSDIVDDGNFLYAACKDGVVYCYEITKFYQGFYCEVNGKYTPEFIEPNLFENSCLNVFSKLEINFHQNLLIGFTVSGEAFIYNLGRYNRPLAILSTRHNLDLTSEPFRDYGNFAKISPSDEIKIVMSGCVNVISLWRICTQSEIEQDDIKPRFLEFS